MVDEAGDSPGWVPLLGIGLLCLVALLIALRQAVGELAPPPAPAAVAADGGVADEGAAGAPAPAAAAAKPAAEE